MDETVLFNTGDFLMALRIINFENTNNNFSEFLKSLYPDTGDKASKKSCSSVDNKQDSSGVTGKGDLPCQCADVHVGDLESPVLNAEAMDVKSTCNRKVDGTANSEVDASQDSRPSNNVESMQSACSLQKQVDRHKIISGFVNVLNQIYGKQQQRKLSVGKEECLSLALNTGNKRGCEDTKGNNDCDSTKECDERRNLNKFDVNIAYHPSELVQTFKSGVNTSCSDLDKPKAGNNAHVNFSEGTTKSVQNGKDQSACDAFAKSECTRSASDCPNTVSNTCSSCDCAVSAPVLNNNNLTSSVFKVYIEPSHDPGYHELPDLTGEFDMFDGSLPLTVKTCRGSSLKQVFKINKSNPNTASSPCLEETLGNKILNALAVQQVTLDLEQCINELILSHEDLQHSYKSLKDYDVQVVGVCPDSGEVITMARLLVYTRTRQQSESFGLPVSPRFVTVMFALFRFYSCWCSVPLSGSSSVSFYCAGRENCTKMDSGNVLATNILMRLRFSTNLVSSRGLDIGLVLFMRVYGHEPRFGP